MRTISKLVQALLAILGWMIFAWLWWKAVSTGPTASQLRSTLTVGAVDLGIILITMLWVRWNVAVYQRKGARKAVPAVTYTYDRDSTGTPVVIPAAVQNGSRSILIDVEGEDDARTKVYASAPLPVPEGV
ncbi:MAG: hypothetical protein ACYCXR_01735 [Coriobacteriia bacterium]